MKRIFIMMAISVCSLVAMAQNNVTGKPLLTKAIQYENDGRVFEASNALYHAWIMGEAEDVNRHLLEDESAKEVLIFIKFVNSDLADSCMYKKLKEVKGREAEDLCLMYEAYNDRNSITEKMMYRLMESPIINFMTSKMHKSIMGDSLTRDEISQNLQKALDDGFLFAYGQMAAIAYEDGRYQDAIKLYEKAFETGCLNKDDIKVIQQLEAKANGMTISPNMRLDIERMEVNSYKYWLELMASQH